MSELDLLLKNKFTELSRRAFSRGCYIYSDFLTIAEQDILCSMAFDKSSAPFTLKGGYAGSERSLACFGDESLCGYQEKPPIACIHISPISQKFADVLSHRDFLGSLLALGLRRNVLGDIIISDNCAYLFCLESVAGYVLEQLSKVKHTSVRCTVTGAPEIVTVLPEPIQINIASERLDAIIAAVYKLSRGESQQLFSQGKVFVNSRLMESSSFCPPTGSIVSVRGCGRFIYEEIMGETRKGRLRASVRIF